MDSRVSLCAVLCCLVALLMSSVLATGQLTVPKTTEADFGDTVTLQCRLETEGRWYVIAWSRLHDNGSDTLLVSLPSGQMVPDWNPDIPKSLRMRVQPLITVQRALVEFHLVVTPLTCADRGRYRCRAVAAFGDPSASTLLIMKQPPGTPQVRFEHPTWTLNTTLSVMCEAQAGLPPQEFHWYYKTPRMRNFQVAEGQSKVVYHHKPGCRVTSLRTLHVRVTPESRGTVYRCALPGKVKEEGLFDQITVQLPPSMGAPSADTRLQDSAACLPPECPLKAAETNIENGSSQPQACLITTTAIGCLAVLWPMIGQFRRLGFNR